MLPENSDARKHETTEQAAQAPESTERTDTPPRVFWWVASACLAWLGVSAVLGQRSQGVSGTPWMMSYAVIVIAITAAGYWTLLGSRGPRRERFMRRRIKATDAFSFAAHLEFMVLRTVLSVMAWAALLKAAIDPIFRDRVKSKKSTR